ncbi:MAG: zf-TFIIB domain-containing protein [Armatimonadota bacterium]|nr:zf-TFIIB domain-containing protein [Armatimonadota bacterium]
MRERLCPNCQIPLRPQVHLGVTIDVCPACAGMWFDADELTYLHQMDESIFPRLDALYQPEVVAYESPWARLCPVCQQPMRPYNYLYTSDIVLDTCDNCGGVWVDHGELEKMYRVLQDARAMEIPPEAKAKMAVAQIEAEAREAKARAEFWQGLFEFLRARPRFW